MASEREFDGLMALSAHVSTLRSRERRSDELARVGVGHDMVTAVQQRLGKESLLAPTLALSTQRDRIRHGWPARNTLLRSGDLQRSYDTKITGDRENGVGSPSPIAEWQENGTFRNGKRHIPPRRPLARTGREGDKRFFAAYHRDYFLHLDL